MLVSGPVCLWRAGPLTSISPIFIMSLVITFENT